MKKLRILVLLSLSFVVLSFQSSEKKHLSKVYETKEIHFETSFLTSNSSYSQYKTVDRIRVDWGPRVTFEEKEMVRNAFMRSPDIINFDFVICYNDTNAEIWMFEPISSESADDKEEQLKDDDAVERVIIMGTCD